MDTYQVLLLFVAFFRKTQRISKTDHRWLRFHLFNTVKGDAYADSQLHARYRAPGGGDPAVPRTGLSDKKGADPCAEGSEKIEGLISNVQ